MTDEQFQKLRTLILDVKTEIAALALVMRGLDKRLVHLEALIENGEEPQFFASDELDELLKTRQSREPHSDSE